MRYYIYFSIIIFSFLIGSIPVAYATETSSSDIKAIIKILRFKDPKVSGKTRFAILYDRTDSASIASAKNVEKLARTIEHESISLDPYLVDIRNASSIRTVVAYVTTGNSNVSLFNKLADNSVLTVTSNDDCVTNGTCVISITTKPKVRIKMNARAARASNVEFQSVFRMMIQEY